MKSLLWLAALATTLTIGCGGPDGRPSNGDDGDDDGSNGGPDSGGNNNGDNCSDASKLVYVVDENNKLSRFDPSTKTFTDIGTLNCPAQTDPIFGIPATPFSMGIDRTPTAWVLYSSGELFKVNVNDASCEPTSWISPSNLTVFGMGFSTDVVGGETDTLFVAGGDDVDPTGSPTSNFASISMPNLSASNIGTVSGWPELTGTGNAELWGFFPSASGSRIEKINKANGSAAQGPFQLSSLAGEPSAWAFAFWGGDFWVFLMKDDETSTTVYHVNGTTGVIEDSTPAPGRTIVGAGVSTCAPTVIL